MKYDAFISYRHGQLDGLVAAKLHKLIENYRIPKKIAQKIGKKRLNRVFRDRDELPTSSNLSQSIEDGIAESEYLLLICSRRLPLSQWCMREVELFSELHGKDKILALLIDGEPDESFPEIISRREVDGEIIHVEPLAADIRADTWKKSLRLLSQEKLRLLAPILGVGYDDLKQRHRQRFIKRVTALAAAAFVAVSAFAVFAQVQFTRISNEMQYKLRNESLVLAEYSENALEDGERDTAVALALAGLPENLENPERPYTASSEKALIDALGWYDLTGGFKPYKTAESDTAPAAVALSPDGKHFAVSFMYKTRIISNVSGVAVAEKQGVLNPVSDVKFLSDSVVLYTAEDGLTAYDFVSDIELWKGERALFAAVSQDKQVIAASDGENVIIYDINGNVKHEINLGGQMLLPPEGAFSNPHYNIFELNASGSVLAVSHKDSETGVSSVILYSTDGSPSIGGNSEIPIAGLENAALFQGAWLGDDIIACSFVSSSPYFSKLYIFDISKMSILFDQENDTVNFVSKASDDTMWFSAGNSVYRFNTEDGSYAPVCSASGNIVDFAVTSDSVIYSDSANYYYYCSLSTGKKTHYSSDYRCDFIMASGDYAVVAGLDSNTLRVLKKKSDDSHPAFIYPDADYQFSEARISEDGERLTLYSSNGIRAYSKDGTMLFDISLKNGKTVTDLQYLNGNAAVLYSDGYAVYGTDGTVLSEYSGADYVKFIGEGILTVTDNKAKVYKDGVLGDFEAVNAVSDDIPMKQIKAARTAPDGTCYVITGTPDGRGLLVKISGGKAETIGAIVANGVFEAFFPEENIFAVAPRTGATKIYKFTALGYTELTDIEADGFAADIEKIGDGRYIANYISSDLSRYALLLNVDFKPIAKITNYADHNDSNIFIAEGDGKIMSTAIHSLGTAVTNAKLSSVPLTQKQKEKYHIAE
ncbi:MAG: toll/interleukin-1 receptor domain-containing protein [Ruminococcus sp.]|jgi:hypothetical protein|nr:toll/interleukin-1 receptor domain-containing protein [Ruminococcus sp.]